MNKDSTILRFVVNVSNCQCYWLATMSKRLCQMFICNYRIKMIDEICTHGIDRTKIIYVTPKMKSNEQSMWGNLSMLIASASIHSQLQQRSNNAHNPFNASIDATAKLSMKCKGMLYNFEFSWFKYKKSKLPLILDLTSKYYWDPNLDLEFNWKTDAPKRVAKLNASLGRFKIGQASVNLIDILRTRISATVGNNTNFGLI